MPRNTSLLVPSGVLPGHTDHSKAFATSCLRTPGRLATDETDRARPCGLHVRVATVCALVLFHGSGLQKSDRSPYTMEASNLGQQEGGPKAPSMRITVRSTE
jgi:hypothetical protein